MKIQKLKKALKKGFTLIELLVVIAIIAVIGTGIAVTYQHMDDHAKTAMEMSDIAGIKKVIKHWSAVRDFGEVPDGFDLLVDTDGELISFYGHAPFEVGTATPEILAHLSAVGVSTAYAHVPDAAIANDSTFVGSSVDTSTTIRTLVEGGTDLWDDAVEFEADQATRDGWTFPADGTYTFSGTNGNSWDADDDTEMDDIEQEVSDIIDSQPVDDLAFLYTESISPYTGQPTQSSVGHEIVSNLGLKPEDIAGADEDYATAKAAGRKYYLVAMGLGRFTSLYQGRAVRADGPPKGKRYSGDDIYSRYLVVLKVPVLKTGHSGAETTETAQIVEVLSPQGLSRAGLEDYLEGDREKLASNN